MTYAETPKADRDRARWQQEERTRREFEKLTGFPRPPRHEREHDLFRNEYSLRGWLVCIGWTDEGKPIYDTE
tara:strand:+ start:2567 stop:2782 length:216 start_codon:yes stop_codon:yes gene_type:complete